MSSLACRNRLADQEFRVVNIEKIGPNEFVITTESKAFGLVTQTVTIVPDIGWQEYMDCPDDQLVY